MGETTDVEITAAGKLYAEAMGEILQEAVATVEHYGPFSSEHEAYAVILEELEELWAEIKRWPGKNRPTRREAIQLAAMVLRFIVEFTEGEGDGR